MSVDRPPSGGRPAKVAGQVFTTREIARFSGLTPSRVRRCVHAGFLRPSRGVRRRFEFGLRDLLVLRATKALLAARIGPRRIAQLVGDLRRQLEGTRDVTSLRIAVERNRIVVSDGRRRWQPDSGQLLLQFDAASASSRVRSLSRNADESDSAAEAAYVSLTRGLALERRAPDQARAAYLEAIRHDPSCVPAHVNLGRLLHESRDLSGAEEHYKKALSLDPEQATATFNLAVLAEDQRDFPLAIHRYLEALVIDPRLPEAHRCLARLYTAQGRHAAARRHLRLYRQTLRRR